MNHQNNKNTNACSPPWIIPKTWRKKEPILYNSHDYRCAIPRSTLAHSMQLVKTDTTPAYRAVIAKAKEILRETPTSGGESLCSDGAIGEKSIKKLRNEYWYMNHLDHYNRPTPKTDAFMCFGTLDFRKLFYLDTAEEGVEDFQKKEFKDMLETGKVFFAKAERVNRKNKKRNRTGESNAEFKVQYSSRGTVQKVIPVWFKGFDKSDNPHEKVAMLHWVAKKQTSTQKGLFSVAEEKIKEHNYRYIFLQVGCGEQSKLAAFYASKGLNIIMLVLNKPKRTGGTRNSVIIKYERPNGFVFWGWKDLYKGSSDRTDSRKKLKF